MWLLIRIIEFNVRKNAGDSRKTYASGTAATTGTAAWTGTLTGTVRMATGATCPAIPWVREICAGAMAAHGLP